MKFNNLTQGSPEWHAHRADHWNASDAPAMMGVSPYKTRSQLLHERYTGMDEEVTAEKQRIFDAGHAYEAQARPLAELIAGKDLYPVVGSEGPYSASFDGIDMAEEIVFEHKTLNDDLRACMPVNDGVTVPDDVSLPEVYAIQMEQQLLVSGGKRALFMASKWDGDQLVEERHCWYYPDLALRQRIVAGWAQFEADLQAYVPPTAAAPAPVGKAPAALPALRIEVTGQVTTSNLAEFKSTALLAIRSVNRELKTDKDFADAEQAVKWCSDVEQRLAAGKDHALSQTTTIDALFRAIDEISAEARQVRLDLEKLVKGRKEAIKGEIVAGAIAAFAAHVQAMACPYLPRIAADFAGAAKNKRTVASLQDAVDTELARVKIEANGHYQRITQGLATLATHAAHAFLFSDVAALVLKAPEDLALVIRTRIADHEAKEAKRLEDERARIRAEEQAKAQREAEAKAQADAAAARAAATPPPVPTPAPAPVQAQGILDRGESQAGKALMPAPAPAPEAAEPATLNLGVICTRLGFTINAAFASEMGMNGFPGPKGSKLYTERQFSQLCMAISRHCAERREEFAAAAA